MIILGSTGVCITFLIFALKVTSTERRGTEEIRGEITKITNSQNTKRTYVQPTEQFLPKRRPLSNPNRTKIIGTDKR